MWRRLLYGGYKHWQLISLLNVLPCSFQCALLSFYFIVVLQALDQVGVLVNLWLSLQCLLSQPLDLFVNLFGRKMIIALSHGDCLLPLAQRTGGAEGS